MSKQFVDVPDERGISDDIKEAALKAAVTMASTILTSVIVWQLTKNW